MVPESMPLHNRSWNALLLVISMIVPFFQLCTGTKIYPPLIRLRSLRMGYLWSLTVLSHCCHKRPGFGLCILLARIDPLHWAHHPMHVDKPFPADRSRSFYLFLRVLHKPVIGKYVVSYKCNAPVEFRRLSMHSLRQGHIRMQSNVLSMQL